MLGEVEQHSSGKRAAQEFRDVLPVVGLLDFDALGPVFDQRSGDLGE
jgi:hypothetical protein